MEQTPGYVRIRGAGSPLLITPELHVEAQLGDGRWLPLRGVSRIALEVSGNQERFVTATFDIELGGIDLEGVTPFEIVWIDRRSVLQKVSAWWKHVLNRSIP